MDNEKILIGLSAHVDTIKAHVNRLKKGGYKIHPLDVDMLRQKTIEFYELVFELGQLVDESTGLKESSKHVPQKPVVDAPPEATEQEPVVEETTVPEQEVIVEETIIPEPVLTPPPMAAPKPEQIIAKPPFEDEKPEPKATGTVEKEEEAPIKPDRNVPQQTTYDLFSDSNEDPVAEKYHAQEQQSIADKMQKSHISNIREAIGINEKFLFINELFNGDLGRYNKILDDINELPTKKGVDTYLLELKIQFQWDDNSEAYLKLRELLERKFR